MFSLIQSTRRAWVLPVLALSMSLASCGSSNTSPTVKSTSAESSPSDASATPTTSPSGSTGGKVSLVGAGASFPNPLYQRWFQDYNKQKPNVQVTYQSVGSGAGVDQFTKGIVDFGASDVAMTDQEIAKVTKGVVLLPMTAGSIVIGYNLKEVPGLKLSRQVYSDIFLGKIKKWSDPAIATVNPGAKLPDKPITVVHRSDGSGTTAVFTKHLSAISPTWASGPKDGKSINWPVGLGAKGNEGVTAQLLQTDGSIGYIEYGYANSQKIPMAVLENKAGKYVEATPDSGAKTLAAVKLPDNLRAFISDPEGPDSYPIVTYTWILAYKTYDDANKGQALKDVLKYALTDGQKTSPELGYIPLPPEVVTKVQAAVDAIK